MIYLTTITNNNISMNTSFNGGFMLNLSDSDIERFNKFIKKSRTCWEWTGSKGEPPRDYGGFQLNGKKALTHRVAWQIKNGAIPKGMFVCHKCDRPSCVNPIHLFLGTPKDNTHDMVRKGRYHVKRGEEVGGSKLTVDDIIKIRSMAQTHSNSVIGEMFGISTGHAGLILNNKRWAHVGKAKVNSLGKNEKIDNVERGDSHHTAKLTETKVLKIREYLKQGIEQQVLAKKYGVSRATICMINNRKRWSHI